MKINWIGSLLNRSIQLFAIIMMCMLVTSSFAQNKATNNSSSKRRSLQTSGGNVINNRNKSIGANSNSNSNQRNMSSTNKTDNKAKATPKSATTNTSNKSVQTTTVNKNQGQTRKTTGDNKKTGAGKNAAAQGQLKMVDKTMIEVLRTRKVEYDEDKKAASPTVIILNSKHISPEKSLIERESILVRQEKEQVVAKEISKIPPDILEFLGDLY